MLDSSSLLRELYPSGLTPEQREIASGPIEKHINTAYSRGVLDGKTGAFNQKLTIVLLVALVGIIVGVGSWLLFQPHPEVFVVGAPVWEVEISHMTVEQAKTDNIVMDFASRAGNEWTFVGVAQYQNLIFIRLVNVKTQIKIVVYRWTPVEGWEFYAEEFQE